MHRSKSSIRLLAPLSALLLATSIGAACDSAGDTSAPDPAAAPDAPAAATPGKFAYPVARKTDQVDDYHGTKVADPYRWMEDLDTDELKAWIEAENEVTFGYLDTIEAREPIKKKLTALWDYERFGVPYKVGKRYFLSKNDGLQNQSVYYWMDKLDGEMKVLIDPNKLSTDGTVALNGMRISENGKYLAYALSEAGSDWKTWHVREVATGKDLPDKIEWSKFSGASWSRDHKGFFYGAYEAPKEGEELEQANYNQRLYYHRLGTTQDKDELIYEDPEHKEWSFGGEVSEDGRYLVIDVGVGTDIRNMLYFKDLKNKKSEVVKLLTEFDASYSFVGNAGPVFWFRTDLDAPKGRVIAIDTRKPARENWKELIPEREATLRGVSVVGKHMVCSYLKDAHSEVRVHDLKGKHVRDVEFPELGSAGGFGGKKKDAETFYAFSSFTRPSTIYRYDVKTGKSEVFREPKVEFDGSKYETKQVFYSSKDGTKVPMFIVHKKGLELDGNNPTYLYAYGGFNIPLTPRFSVPDAVWLEMGGVYAQPSLRGGGEYGEEWHQGGMKLNKQNVFDDFAAAAEFLIGEGYTKSEKLAIGGRSNGGLLVGASITQRPELFGAALAGVGVMDMLRFQKFTIGWAWVSDYGSSDNADEFKALHAYSPLHNVKDGVSYPSTMVYTADHDDRVVPSHSFKFAARLQEAHVGDAPVMIRIETKAGHGAGKPTSKRIEEWADLWGFLSKELDFTPAI